MIKRPLIIKSSRFYTPTIIIAGAVRQRMAPLRKDGRFDRRFKTARRDARYTAYLAGKMKRMARAYGEEWERVVQEKPWVLEIGPQFRGMYLPAPPPESVRLG